MVKDHVTPRPSLRRRVRSKLQQRPGKEAYETAKDPAALQRHPSLMEIILCSHQCRSFKQFRAEGKRAASPPKPRPDLRPMSGLSSGLVSDCPRQRQHAAAVRAARRLPHEIYRSIAVRSADCERGSASEDSQSCSRHPPPKDPRGRARDSDARYSAAHPARHSYTADHLAGTPRAQPLLSSDAWVWGSGSGSGSGSALTGHRGWMDWTSRAQA